MNKNAQPWSLDTSSTRLCRFAKQRTIITILLALVTMAGQGQTIKASYEDILDSLPTVMQEYMAMQGVQHLCVTLRSVFNGKRAKIAQNSWLWPRS